MRSRERRLGGGLAAAIAAIVAVGVVLPAAASSFDEAMTTRESGNSASQESQAIYYRQLTEWTRQAGILTFVFEAFDEPWKGCDDPDEPEKHWGLYTVERKPKLVMQEHSAAVLQAQQRI